MSLIPATLTVRAAAGQHWDCVVIGAGPAGAMAARELARQGHHTLLVDRKQFPRDKVCGACVNGRARRALQVAGLGGFLEELHAVPLTGVRMSFRGRGLDLPLPDSVVVSRRILDAALVREAVAAGADFLPGCTATIEHLDEHPVRQTIQLRTSSETDRGVAPPSIAQLITHTTIAADGLAHACLQKLGRFHSSVDAGSRVGLGATLAASSSDLESGRLCMAVGCTGYVGLVRLPDGQLNLAAALDPHVLKTHSTHTAAVEVILREAGVRVPDGLHESASSGTPALTRRLQPVAVPGVFVIGDAAGYVEPFTGEGITWALSTGFRVAEFVTLARTTDAQAACRGWQRSWRRSVRARQKWCRRLAWLVRHPTGVGMTMSLFRRWPGLARPILRTMTDQQLEVPVSTV